ncbi:hypothetical protein ACLK2I_13795 [Escherichia coli]
MRAVDLGERPREGSTVNLPSIDLPHPYGGTIVATVPSGRIGAIRGKGHPGRSRQTWSRWHWYR